MKKVAVILGCCCVLLASLSAFAVYQGETIRSYRQQRLREIQAEKERALASPEMSDASVRDQPSWKKE